MDINDLYEIDPDILDDMMWEIQTLKNKKILRLAPDAPVFVRQERFNKPFDEIAKKPLQKLGHKNPDIALSLKNIQPEQIIGWWKDDRAYFPIINRSRR